MVVDRVGKRCHCCEWESPAKTSCYDPTESPNILFSKFVFVGRIAYAWNDVVILILVEHKVNFFPLFLKLCSIALDVLLQNSVLELIDFLITPQKRQVCEVNDVQVWLPETGLALGLLVPQVNNEGQEFCIVVLLKDLWVSVVESAHLRATLPDIRLVY